MTLLCGDRSTDALGSWCVGFARWLLLGSVTDRGVVFLLTMLASASRVASVQHVVCPKAVKTFSCTAKKRDPVFHGCLSVTLV